MDQPLFDPRRRALQRQRARRFGGDLFLHVRALEDIVGRIDPTGAIMLVGPLDPPFPATRVDSIDDIDAVPGSLDTIVLLGALDTESDLPATLFALGYLLRPGGTLAGCVAGGASLPRLRHAVLEADRYAGHAAQRVHPMMDGASLASLLQSTGFANPVIAVDRLDVVYPSLDKLVDDLRSGACTSALAATAPPLTRAQLAIARTAFLAGQPRAAERFDLLHFTARAPTA